MAYITPVHQPSSVRHALKLNFLSANEECLTVAKANRLEFYIQTPDGLSLACSRTVYGRVNMLNKLRPASATTDHLFVGTDRFMYFTLSWNAETKQLRTEKSYVDQADKSARDSQTGDRCLMDPTGRFMTLELYEGVVTVIPIAQKVRRQGDPEIGSLRDPITVRIEELFVRSSTFFQSRLREKEEPVRLALIFEDSQKKVRLKVRQLAYSPGLSEQDSAELEELQALQEDLELGASHLIPVPAPTCGMLILGETSISYFEYSSHDFIEKPLSEATIFVTWVMIDRQRFVLADEYGKLYLLMLQLDSSDRVEGWKLDVIGEASRASVLLYLGEGNVFVGSHQGDSQVIKIKPKSMEILQTFPNIAPILDFTIMDMGSRGGEGQVNEYSSGQARIVTGSGAFKDGSLRSVRSGVGLEDLGMLGQMENITDMFSLKSNPASHHADTLVVGFVDETRIFRFSADGDVEEVDTYKGLSFDQGTLYAANVFDGRTLQATSSTIRLTDCDSGMVVGEWNPPTGKSITAITASADTAVISVGGADLLVLDIGRDLSVSTSRSFDTESQIACINMSPSNASICIVGFWNSSTISILRLEDLSTVQTETVSNEVVSVPRSLLLVNILEDHNPILFIAMADGDVITYNMDPSTFQLSNRRSTILGTQQAGLRALPRGDGLYNVFATCEHPSLIYGSEGRLVYSAITAANASCVCSFDAECYPGAIAIASRSDLKLVVVDEERSTHVQGLHVGETVRRIAYSAGLKAFGLGTIQRMLEDGVEVVRSSFKLADEVVFKVLATHELHEDELVESVMRCELDDGYGHLVERFVVGTAFLDDLHADSVRGRIVVLEVTADRALKVVLEHSVKGACRCLAMVEGHIVAALIKTVVVNAFKYDTPSTPYLSKAASYRTSTAPIDLAISGNLIAIADLMKSVSLVEFSSSSKRPSPSTSTTAGATTSLTEVARHFQTTWATAVELVDSNTFLEADAEGNLLVLQHDVKSEFADDRRRLKVTSEILLGEMVNRIRRIGPVTSASSVSSTAVVTPKAFLATVEGSIYLFALIHPSRQNLLMELQASLARHTQAPGGVPFARYRAYRSAVRDAGEEGPFRFVDGELLERFLELGDELQEEVCRGFGGGVEEVRGLVEGLRRLR